MRKTDTKRSPVLEIEKLPDWALKQGGVLERDEARFLITRRTALKGVATSFKTRQTVLRKQRRIMPLGLDFPRLQVERLVKQAEGLLSWYARAHPSRAWFEAIGFSLWQAGGWIAVIDPMKAKTPKVLWRYLRFQHNDGESSDHIIVSGRLLRSRLVWQMRHNMIWYSDLYRSRKALLRLQSARGEHVNLIDVMRPKLAPMKTAHQHFNGECEISECPVLKHNPDVAIKGPHLNPILIEDRALRYAKRIFAAHALNVISVCERGRRFITGGAGMVEVPFTHLVPGWDTAQVIKARTY